MADTLGTLKTAYDLAKDLVNLHDATVRQGKIGELQRQIIDAQESALAANEERSTLVETVRSLKSRVAELETWGTEKNNYKLVDVAGSRIKAYAPKDTVEGTEPSHYLCADCYSDNNKSFLQSETRFPGRTEVLVCHRCGADLYISGGWHPEHSSRRRR